MEKAKLAVAFVLLTVFSVSAVWAEYTLMMRFGITFSVATVSGLSVLLIALLRAPEGYEDETGFHIGALADAALR
jgi:membrane protein implicated in regulation of membrane protease activity